MHIEPAKNWPDGPKRIALNPRACSNTPSTLQATQMSATHRAAKKISAE